MADQKSHLQVRKNTQSALIKALIVPLLVLAFFLAAPRWLDSRLHDAIRKVIMEDTSHTPEERTKGLAKIEKTNFEEVSLNCPPGQEKLHDNFEHSGIVGNFQRLRWGLWLSFGLVAGLVLSLVSISMLNKRASGSPEALTRSYRLAWIISVAASLLTVFLLIPLLTYGCFEFTVLLMDQYVPKLLIIIALGGLVALGLSAKALLKKIPLQFNEPMSREVTPSEASVLWEKVREAAAKLQTEPPDRILIGLQLNFYVTELAVLHDGGKTEGRTLYLSYPLLKQMPEDEVLAIIGHELGHFMGNDTRLTREFYPLRLKIHGTLVAMAQSGWVGWPSFQFLSFFHWCFGQTEQATSRSREFLADKRGASLTSPRTAAQALVRFQVLAEAFERNLKAAMKDRTLNPLQMSLAPVVRDQLGPETAFWSQLFEKHLPHPMDSHPPLKARLESLGETISGDDAKAIALADTHNAYDQWFAGHDDLFASLTKQAEDLVSKMRERSEIVEADANTESGKELLNRHFPEIKWQGKTSSKWVGIIFIGLLAALCATGAVFIDVTALRLLFGGIGAVFAVWGVLMWKRRTQLELTLNADGLFCSKWSRPLLFKEVEKISAQENYSIVTVNFRLKEKQLPITKSHLLPFKRRNVSLTLSGYTEKPVVMWQTIIRYLTRQTKEDVVEAQKQK